MTIPSENLTPLAHAAQNRCFGCGKANPTGLLLDFLLAEDQSVVCNAIVPDTFEGPVGYVHGGIIATLLDEAMSKAVRARGITAMTRNIEVDYQRPVPSLAPIRLEGRLVSSEGRKHFTESAIIDSRGKTLATSKALFIQLFPI